LVYSAEKLRGFTHLACQFSLNSTKSSSLVVGTENAEYVDRTTSHESLVQQIGNSTLDHNLGGGGSGRLLLDSRPREF